MNNSWTHLTEEKQLDELITLSDDNPVFIFKHPATSLLHGVEDTPATTPTVRHANEK